MLTAILSPGLLKLGLFFDSMTYSIFLTPCPISNKFDRVITDSEVLRFPCVSRKQISVLKKGSLLVPCWLQVAKNSKRGEKLLILCFLGRASNGAHSLLDAMESNLKAHS